jgi:thiamine-monophosphate kinase
VELSRIGEFGLIARLAGLVAGTRSAAGEVTLGIGDDAALLGLPPGTELVATIDGLIEEVHFRRDWTKPEELGWKALAVNVSDLGAMGARPLGCMVTLAVPAATPVRWIERLYRGLAECAAAYGCPLVGGDTVRAPTHLALSVAALGTVRAGKVVRRSGAQAGDLVCVTGVLGDSGAGLALLEAGRGQPRESAVQLLGDVSSGSATPGEEDRERGLESAAEARRSRDSGKMPKAGEETGGGFTPSARVAGKRYAPLVEWHRTPRPPVAAGAMLAETGLATAMMDLSDGLASDLGHLARASGVGALVEAERLPISDAARRAARELGVDPVEWALYGGEDYQLLFTVRPERFAEVPPVLGPLRVAATIVGRIGGRGVRLRSGGRTAALRPRGFKHFSEGEPGVRGTI